MPTVQELMHANLLEVFGERDPGRRLEAIRRTYTDDVSFADTEGSVQGHDALSAKAQAILDGAPGLVFQLDGDFYQAGNLGYQAWALGPADEPPVVRGVDMGLERDGLLKKVYTVVFA